MIAIIFVAESLVRKRLYIPQTWLSWCSFILIIYICGSLFYSDIPTWTALKIVFILNISLLVVVMYNAILVIGERAMVRSVGAGGIIAGSVMLVQFLLQFIIGKNALQGLWISITPLFHGEAFGQSVIEYNSWFVNIAGIDVFRAIGLFPDPHIAGYYTGMIAPLTLACILWAKGKWRLWWVCGGSIIVVANLLTFSRGAEVGLLIGCVIAAMLMTRYVRSRGYHIFFAGMALVLIFLALPGNPLTSRFVSSFDHADTSNTSRIEIWEKAIDIASQQPIIGTGIGAASRFYEADADYRRPIYAHNLFLDVLVEIGFLGLFLFSCMIGGMIRSFWHKKNILGACAIISISIFLGHSLFDTPIFSVHTLPVLLFFLALALYYDTQLQKTTYKE